MKLITIIITACILFMACSKSELIEKNKCDRATLLSDKYSWDSVFIKTDTLWPLHYAGVKFTDTVCGKNLDTIIVASKKDIWTYWNPATCPAPNPSMPLFRIEHKRYVIGNRITQPLKLK